MAKTKDKPRKQPPPFGIAVCGCKCEKCYCNEGACHVHPHCFGKHCDTDFLFGSLGINIEQFREFVSVRFEGSDKQIAKKIIKVFGKW